MRRDPHPIAIGRRIGEDDEAGWLIESDTDIRQFHPHRHRLPADESARRGDYISTMRPQPPRQSIGATVRLGIKPCAADTAEKAVRRCGFHVLCCGPERACDGRTVPT